jgi:uncharacterized membrane protein (DUF373 family)
MEFIGFIILGIMIALSNAAGIGGGGIIVPICIIFFQFNTKESVALSNFCIFCASLVRFIMNYRDKHPQKEAKVIDYGIIMVMFPMVLFGSLVGVMINVMLPDSILLGGLTIILVWLSVSTFLTAKKLWKNETEAKNSQQQENAENQPEEEEEQNDQGHISKNHYVNEEPAEEEQKEGSGSSEDHKATDHKGEFFNFGHTNLNLGSEKNVKEGDLQSNVQVSKKSNSDEGEVDPVLQKIIKREQTH